MKARAAAVVLGGLILLLSVAILPAPLGAAETQQSKNVARIGILRSSGPPQTERVEALQQGLGESGYVGVFESRSPEGRYEQLSELANELVRLRVDIIVVSDYPAALAVKRATTTIPIVLAGAADDPVGRGLAESLARPGGNITGVTGALGGEIAGKYVQLLREAFPKISRIAVLWNQAVPPAASRFKSMQLAAERLGVKLESLEVRGPDTFDAAFAAFKTLRVNALIVDPDPVNLSQKTRIIDFAAKNRIPTFYGLREFVDAGGLMAYSPDWLGIYRRAGVYLGKILQGAKPADLPIEQPTKYELMINMKAARALGLTIPTALLLRADQVIE